MIPFIYGLILQLLRTDKLIDSDLFTSQFEIVNDFFVDFLNKDGQKGTHTLQANKEFTETLFYGGTQKTTKGKPERKLNEIAKRSLYGNTTENYYNSLSFSLYKRFYFMNEFYIFFEDTLNNNNSFIDYKKNIQNIKSAEYKEFNFLNSSEVKPILQGIYDAIPESDRNRRNVVNLKELFSLN